MPPKSATKAPKTTKTKAAKAKSQVEKVVKYESLGTVVYDDSMPLTAAVAKDLLGWIESEEDLGEKAVPELKAKRYGKNVILEHNTNNRYITGFHLDWLVQEILNKRWKMNGETIVIGKYGNVLSGQHRLIAVVLAAHQWAGVNKAHWESIWQTEPWIESVVVTGIDESDDTFKTLNSGKPSTMSEVFYRAEYFQDKPMADRKTLARTLEYAVRLLWERTGAKDDAYSPRCTHGEASDFINRHPKILNFVRHVFEEDQSVDPDNPKLGKRLSRYLPQGTMAGLMYLMAASATDGNDYWNADPPGEKKGKKPIIDWSRESTAETFFTLIANEKDSKALQNEFNGVHHPTDVEITRPTTRAEKVLLLAKAWGLYVANEKLNKKNLTLDVKVNEDGELVCVEWDTDFLGIDKGDPHNKVKEEKETAESIEEAQELADEAIEEASNSKTSPEDDIDLTDEDE